MGKVDDAGRAIAGLLTYNPGPGLYSRLERAVQQMPENVRVQELPGLLKRYKEGVPGWELKATDLDSTIAGRDVVPREDLLAAVKERSPVYTHSEALFGGSPESVASGRFANGARGFASERLGAGVSQGVTKYHDYGHGGDDYTELLLVQPGADGKTFGTHWAERHPEAVAHARYDTHGDALRINELQSDLGIHNRKIREIANGPTVTARYPNGQVYATDDMGVERPVDPELPFPLEDAWSDLLVKRLALEAARGGHRAIEVASPRAIADKVGGNIDNYEHFYGKVVPGALERLGRKMGGLTEAATASYDPAILKREIDELTSIPRHGEVLDDAAKDYRNMLADLGLNASPRVSFAGHMNHRLAKLAAAGDTGVFERIEANRFRDAMAELIYADTPRETVPNLDAARNAADQIMPRMMARASQRKAIEAPTMASGDAISRLERMRDSAPAPRRYIMSDEMRRRLIEGGVGAAVGTGIMSQDDLIERLNQ